MISGWSSYCKQEEIKNTETTKASQDYVSGIDFSRLPLDQIPADVKCAGITGDEWSEFCDKVKNQDQSICYPNECDYPLSYAQFVMIDSRTADRLKMPPMDSSWIIYTGYESIDEESCRLDDFSFQGDVEVSSDGKKIVCSSSEDGQEITLNVVHFSDLNADGFQDVTISVSSYRNVASVISQLTTKHKGKLMQLRR